MAKICFPWKRDLILSWNFSKLLYQILVVEVLKSTFIIKYLESKDI